MPAPSHNRAFTAFLALATVALCILVVLLSRQNRRLRADNELLAQALLREQTRGSLGIGERLDPLTVFDAAGATRPLAFSGDRPTLILLTSGDCPHCTDTLPLWDRVLAQTQVATTGIASVVLLQVDADRPDQLKPALPSLPALGVTDAAATWLHKIPVSPAALWADREGVIRRAWHGVPSQRDLNELAAALLGADPSSPDESKR